ncbi:MAG: VIT and VWA domain-containing protein [Zoogloeaceae bacterium]|jgi:Ca-activated chloride channel family protein|nr:VIT and VWA domain-containing protein [Zoogloeaceae bacterium]
MFFNRLSKNFGAFWWCLVFAMLAAPSVFAQDESGLEKTQSPYFYVPGADPAVDALPLKSTQVDVLVAGIIADVTVTQTYKNEGSRPIEANYVFPGSTRAAVHAMNVRLADRLITAKIREKQQAKTEYAQAKKEGKTAALLEQERPNVFQMHVANIMPGDEVRVELRYTELLAPTDGRYQFVFPAVVGPRYNSPQSSSAHDEWVAQPTLRAGADSPARFDLQVQIDTPIGIKEVRSASHNIHLTRENERRASVRLVQGNPGKAEEAVNNRDFILDYRLSGDTVESGVMLMRGEDENFFLAMIEPPKVAPSQVITPREYIFVVDVSGSMHGFPLDTAKVMLRELIGGLRPGDTFNVLLFSGDNAFLNEQSVPATPEYIDNALRMIDRQSGSGSTELIPALRRVYAQPKSDEVSRTIVVVTDGYVSVEREAFNLIRRNLDKANLFSFGIGSSVNRHLMEGMARAGMGEPFIITTPEEAREQAARFRQMIASPVLTHVRARFEGAKTYDVTPDALPDVLAARPVIIFGKWLDAQENGQLIIEGHTADGAYRQTLPFYVAVGNDAQQYAVLRHLWARHRIAELSDQEGLEGSGALREKITALGLKYSLLTRYTSFLAVDQQIRNPDAAAAASVQQPLPLPQGVSNLAVSGAYVPGTPEPESIGALLVTLAMLAMMARRHHGLRRHRLTS